LFFVTYGGVKLARVVVQGTLNEGEGSIQLVCFGTRVKNIFLAKKI
jgi:hypothetical protein